MDNSVSSGNVSVNSLALTAGTLNIASGATLNLVNQPGGITDINANSGLILAGTFEAGGPGTSALAGLASVEGTLTLANGQTTTVTPSSGTFTTSSAGNVNVQQGSTFAVTGGLNNSGLILTGNGANDTGVNSLAVSGSLTNSGDVLLGAANDRVSAGTISNAGAIALDGANQTLTVAGAFNNSGGELTFNSSNGGTVSVAGAFTNSSGASMNMSGSGDMLSAASFANSGEMALGAKESLKSTGNFDNSGGSITIFGGTMTVGGSFNNATGASLSMFGNGSTGSSSVSASGTFTNAGTVTMQGANDTLTASGAFTDWEA